MVSFNQGLFSKPWFVLQATRKYWLVPAQSRLFLLHFQACYSMTFLTFSLLLAKCQLIDQENTGGARCKTIPSSSEISPWTQHSRVRRKKHHCIPCCLPRNVNHFLPNTGNKYTKSISMLILKKNFLEIFLCFFYSIGKACLDQTKSPASPTSCFPQFPSECN